MDIFWNRPIYCSLSKVKREEGSCIFDHLFFILIIYDNQHFTVPMCSFCVISTLATSGNERVKTEFDTGLHKHKSGAMGHRALLKHSLDLITVKYIVHLVILHASDF